MKFDVSIEKTYCFTYLYYFVTKKKIKIHIVQNNQYDKEDADM